MLEVLGHKHDVSKEGRLDQIHIEGYVNERLLKLGCYNLKLSNNGAKLGYHI